MYFAAMYCYGMDNQTVGITGIVGCLGVVYVGTQSMYAIHIPDNSTAGDAAAALAFVQFVTRNEQHLGKGHGSLYLFANGTNRMKGEVNAADAIGLAIKTGLSSPPTVLYRIMKRLGAKSGGQMADSVAIQVNRRVRTFWDGSDCNISYKRHDDVTYDNSGTPESGQYKIFQAFQGSKAPDDLVGGWHKASGSNVETVKL